MWEPAPVTHFVTRSSRLSLRSGPSCLGPTPFGRSDVRRREVNVESDRLRDRGTGRRQGVGLSPSPHFSRPTVSAYGLCEANGME